MCGHSTVEESASDKPSCRVVGFSLCRYLAPLCVIDMINVELIDVLGTKRR